MKLALFLVLLSTSLAAARAGELTRDIEYGRADGERLLLDAHAPDGAGPFPVAILVHGGGWTGGDKGGSDHPGNGADISPWFATLSAANFTWFSINYRLAPQHRWPACLEDVQTAIRWVKAHAAEFKGDPHRIALIGHSAGGHLVCLAATLAGSDMRVQAVVGFAAVSDLEADAAVRGGLSPSLQKLFDRPGDVTPGLRPLLRDASAIDHVHAGLPPFLLLHGDADKSVRYAQSLAFQEKLRAAGVSCDLITIPRGPHGLLTWSQLAPDYPERFIAWLREKLGLRISRAPRRLPRSSVAFRTGFLLVPQRIGRKLERSLS